MKFCGYVLLEQSPKLMTMFRTVVNTILCAIAIAACFPVMAEPAVSKFTFCYENQELFPHYLTNDMHVPEHKPGAAIETIQVIDQELKNVNINFVRMPWKRCLSQLNQGKADAVIGRYTKERSEFAVYPTKANGELDTSKAISTTQSCFIHDKSVSLLWDGKNLQAEQPLGLIAPMGYSLVDDLKALGFDVYESSNIGLAHKLLFTGKFNVSLSDCKLKNKPDFIVENPHPVTSEHGFLFFSKQYWSQNQAVVEQVWNQLKTIDKQSIYRKYQ